MSYKSHKSHIHPELRFLHISAAIIIALVVFGVFQFVWLLPSTSPITLLGMLVSIILFSIYIFGVVRKKLKTTQRVYRTWWVLGLIELSILFIGLPLAGKWAESFEMALMSLLLFLCFALPFGFMTLLLWVGLRGLERIVETGIQSEEQNNRKLRFNCPQCGRPLYGATQEMIGDTGVCPKCKAEFVIEQKQ